jgi:DNA end-binding protein Ku
VRALEGALVLETLYYAEDIRSPAEIVEAVEETETQETELGMARQLVESLAGAFDPSDYANSYRNDVRAMLEAKVSGAEIVRPEPAPEAPVVDLMEALRQSIAATKGGEKAPARRSQRRKAKTA